MDSIIKKLDKIDEEDGWSNWSLEEKTQLLTLYLIISKKENRIFDLIYRYHYCDSWEDIFRDYDTLYLKDKERGVKIALKNLKEEDNEDND